jgi:hypothetical protein
MWTYTVQQLKQLVVMLEGHTIRQVEPLSNWPVVASKASHIPTVPAKPD